MATGMQTYLALKTRTAHLPMGSAWPINGTDFKDLCKLTIRELVSQGYDEAIADEATEWLHKGLLGPFSRSVGLQLSVHPLAMSLVTPRPSADERENHLRQLLNSRRRKQVSTLLYAFYSAGSSLVGVRTIETILEHEYHDLVETSYG